MSARLSVLVLAIAAITLLSLGAGLAGAPSAGATSTGSHLTTAATSTAASASSSSSLASRAAYEQQILSTAKADHIPMAAVSLPNLLGQASVSNGVVSPLTTVAPAPMGLGVWGVENTTGTAVPYTIETNSWEGTITINNVNTFLVSNDGALSTSGANNTFGVQLNTVTTDTTVGTSTTNSFWTQNVAYWNLYPGSITLLDNVWNFSSPATALTAGTIYSGNGTPVYPEYYYDFGPTIPVSLPVTVHLYLNSSTTDIAGIGYTTVRFGYDIVSAATLKSEASGVYDTVLFASSLPVKDVPNSPFLVDGSQLTPTDFLLYDAELMIGGPGGGTTTSVYGISGSESLQYWNAKDREYVTPPSAWNVATDTGESSEGIAETYTTPGTVNLAAGPSIPAPLWGATPGGNLGATTFAGPISPSNAFVFFTPGTTFDTSISAWAPTQTASSVSYALPPGTYTIDAMLSDYSPIQTTVHTVAGETVHLNLNLARNYAEGVYTPLDAWNNGQLAALSSYGTGTAGNPYVIENNPAPHGLNPAFSEMNDYLYPVFPGLLIAGTTAHVDLNQPSLFPITYASGYDAVLAELGLPTTNNLAFEIFDSSNVAIWDAKGITGWFFYEDYGPSGGVPLANVVIWGGTNDLVGDSTFLSQGSSLLLAGSNPDAATGNVIWGNTFVNSTVLSPTMYPGDGVTNGPPIAIFAFEGGDLIYNNAVETSITAYAPPENIFTGALQPNLEYWNLPMVEPWYYVNVVDGYALSGTIVPSFWQGGNYWADYIPAYGLPYDEYGYIYSGGDYFPLPITAYSVTFELSGAGFGVTWSATVNGVTETTRGSSLVFYETPGAYAYTDAVVSGRGTISPASGTVNVVNHNVGVSLHLSGGGFFR